MRPLSPTLSGEVISNRSGGSGRNSRQAVIARSEAALAEIRLTGTRTQAAAIPSVALAHTATRMAPSYRSAGISRKPAASEPAMAPTVFQAYTRAVADAASPGLLARTRTASG